MPPLITFSGCNTCSLKNEWPKLRHPKMVVKQPDIPSEYRIVIIGEAPGEQEDTYGRPFVGRAGQQLRDYIPEVWQKRAYWMNIVRCRPPGNRTPTVQEISCCSTYLEDDLAKIKPHVILGLGDTALSYFFPGGNVSKLRGIKFPVKLKDGSACWFVSTYHPSYVSRMYKKDDDGNLTNVVLPVFSNDLKKVFRNVDYFVDNPPKIYTPITPKDIVYPKTLLEAENLFDRLKDHHAKDYETHQLKPYMYDARILTAAYSDGDLHFAFPVQWPGSMLTWGKDALKKFAQKRRKWIAQSSAFEYCWSWWMTEEWDQNFEDTEILARLDNQRTGVGNIESLSKIHLGVNVKEVAKRGDYEVAQNRGRLVEFELPDVLYYNALDSWSECLIEEIIRPKLSKNDIDNYYRSIESIKSTVAMEVKGLHVNLDESQKLDKELARQQQSLVEKARLIPAVKSFEAAEQKVFSLSSPPLVGHVLVNYCGFRLPETATGKPSVDKDDLAKFAGQHALIDLRLDYADASTQRNTFITPIITGQVIGRDGLMHPCYKVVHTATYRLSSEGPNIQNFPKRKHKEIRRQIVAPSGYVMAAFDYGQLEARVIAMLSKDPALIRSIILDEDIHWKWLNRLLELYPDYIKRLADKAGITLDTDENLKLVKKAGRDTIKTDFVFASFYGSKAGSVASRAMLPQHIADKLLGEFWGEYNVAKKWVEGMFTFYQTYGYVESLTGRIRNEVLPGNEVTNTPSQGSAAEIVLEAQNALWKKAVTEQDYNYMPRINIHDDLVFFLPDDDRLPKYIKVIGQEIVTPRFDFVVVPLMTEARVGYDWASLAPVTKFIGDYHKYGH